MTIHELEQASRLAVAAVQMDQQGSTQEAIGLYQRAVDFLHAALRNPELTASQRPACERSLQSYQARVAQLQAVMHPQSTVALPQPPGAAGPSVVEVGVEGLKVLNREGGKYIVAGVNKGIELNQKYDITGKAVATATTAVRTVGEVNEKYRVTERVSAAATATVASIKQANEEHKIVEKLGTIASATVKKISEVNTEYHITERVGAALVSGLNYAAATAQGYLSSSTESGSGGAAIGSGEATPPQRPPPPHTQQRSLGN